MSTIQPLPQLPRRRIIAAGLSALLLSGCSLVSVLTHEPPTVAPPPPAVGYGNVNSWAADPEALPRAAAKAGVPWIHVEALGWAGYENGLPGYASDDAARRCAGKLKTLVETARRLNRAVFISVSNANMEARKHGNQWPTSAAAARSRIEIVVQALESLGPDDILVQIVGESRGAWDAIDRAYAARLKARGFAVCWNGSGGQPKSLPAGYDAYAYHPASKSTKIPAGAIVVTDHSGILAQLSGGDVYAPRYDPDACRAYRAAHPDRLIVFYGFSHPSPDTALLEKLGK